MSGNGSGEKILVHLLWPVLGCITGFSSKNAVGENICIDVQFYHKECSSRNCLYRILTVWCYLRDNNLFTGARTNRVAGVVYDTLLTDMYLTEHAPPRHELPQKIYQKIPVWGWKIFEKCPKKILAKPKRGSAWPHVAGRVLISQLCQHSCSHKV